MVGNFIYFSTKFRLHLTVYFYQIATTRNPSVVIFIYFNPKELFKVHKIQISVEFYFSFLCAWFLWDHYLYASALTICIWNKLQKSDFNRV